MKKAFTLILFSLICLQLNAKSVINTNSSWIILDDLIDDEERSQNEEGNSSIISTKTDYLLSKK